MDQLYPRKPKQRAVKSYRPWMVRYDLIYDNGIYAFTEYYRTEIGARVSAWWKHNVSSYGGTANLYRNNRARRR